MWYKIISETILLSVIESTVQLFQGCSEESLRFGGAELRINRRDKIFILLI